MESLVKNHNSTIMNTVMSKRLLGVLQQYRKRDFILVEPGGNAGDLLIYKGFHKLADVAGVKYRSVSHDDFMKTNYDKQEVVYIHGGGGYIQVWSGTPALALHKALSTHQGVVISGPATFVDDKEYLTKTLSYCFKNNVTSRFMLFTREKTSFAIVKPYLPSYVELEIDHDTALNLKREDLIKSDIKGKYKLVGIRHDKEMTSQQTYDYLNWMDPVFVTKGFDDWVNFHAQAKEIITNRTHSSIVGSILEIPTTLMANSYHKNRSIWEFSLRDRGVQWLDHLKSAQINKLIASRGRLRGFFTSPKYINFRKNLLVNLGI